MKKCHVCSDKTPHKCDRCDKPICDACLQEDSEGAKFCPRCWDIIERREGN